MKLLNLFEDDFFIAKFEIPCTSNSPDRIESKISFRFAKIKFFERFLLYYTVFYFFRRIYPGITSCNKFCSQYLRSRKSKLDGFPGIK